MKHRCPPRCHRCPDLHGEIMPGCMGTAVLAHGPFDMSFCTCHRSASPDNDATEKQIRDLQKRVAVLEFSLKDAAKL